MRVVALLLIVGTSSGTASGQFDVRSVDCAQLGSPLSVAGTPHRSHVDGGNSGPTGDSIEQSSPNNWLEYHSYPAIDTQPSAPGSPQAKGDGFQANPGDLSLLGNPFDQNGEIGALWFMDPNSARPQVAAVPQTLFGGARGLFLGRFTFRSTTGAIPAGNLSLGANGVVVDIRDFGTTAVGSPQTDSLLVRFTAFNTTVQQGLDGGNLGMYPTGNQYQLIKIVTQAGPLPGGTARWEVNDLYVVQVPGPASLAVVSLASMAFASRRRQIHL